MTTCDYHVTVQKSLALRFTFMTWAFSEVKAVRLHAQLVDVGCLKLQ